VKYYHLLAMVALFLIVVLGGWLPGLVFLAAAAIGVYILDKIDKKELKGNKKRRKNLSR
jgi:hypothetical protein